MSGEVVIVAGGKKEIVLKENEQKTVLILTNEDCSLKVRLSGEGSQLRLLGAVVARREKVVKVQTEIIHQARDTRAKIVLKGVVFDTARVNIFGSVVIDRGARDSDDSLTENILLLGDGARGESYPYLEIDENDVTAKHAATVGQIGEEELFYLSARGVAKNEAEKLVTAGFLAPILGEIPDGQRGKIAQGWKVWLNEFDQTES